MSLRFFLDRNQAIKVLVQDENLVMIRKWQGLEGYSLYPFSEVDPIFFQTHNTATCEDLYDCNYCGKSVLIFEDVCPNCGNFAFPSLGEQCNV